MKERGGEFHTDLFLIIMFDVGFYILDQVRVAIDILFAQIGGQIRPEAEIVIVKFFKAEDLIHSYLQIVVSPELLYLRNGTADDQPHLSGYVVAACLDIQKSKRLCFSKVIEQLLGQKTSLGNLAGFDAEDQLPRLLPGDDAGRFFFGSR